MIVCKLEIGCCQIQKSLPPVIVVVSADGSLRDL